jgi:hypothetical protein
MKEELGRRRSSMVSKLGRLSVNNSFPLPSKVLQSSFDPGRDCLTSAGREDKAPVRATRRGLLELRN